MSPHHIAIASVQRPELEAALGDRLYEFNTAATGIRDGALLNAAVTSERGELVAGLTGHTWGGCCEITRLWVAASERGRGVGSALLAAAEDEARRRGCTQMVLSTHSFQAPRFYERRGFVRVGAFPDYPAGHEQVFYLKRLTPPLAPPNPTPG